MSSRRPQLLAALALLGVAAAIAVSLILHAPERSVGARVQEVTEQLRCPTCVSQSVAESNSPMAQSMRRTVREQLRAGVPEDDVVAWFRSRYGDGVVLRPRAGGLGTVLWVAPVVAVLAGAGIAASAVVRTRRGVPQGRTPAAVPLRRLVGVGAILALVGVGVPVAVGAGRSQPSDRSGSVSAAAGSGGTAPAALTEEASAALSRRQGSATDRRLGSEEPARAGSPHRAGQTGRPGVAAWSALARDLESQQAYGEAARAWRKALHLRPGSPALRTRLSFDLLRAGRPAAAASNVTPVAGRPGKERALAVLVLGLARRAAGEPGADQTLRRFLRIAPEHPAAAEVRRLLEEDR